VILGAELFLPQIHYGEKRKNAKKKRQLALQQPSQLLKFRDSIKK